MARLAILKHVDVDRFGVETSLRKQAHRLGSRNSVPEFHLRLKDSLREGIECHAAQRV